MIHFLFRFILYSNSIEKITFKKMIRKSMESTFYSIRVVIFNQNQLMKKNILILSSCMTAVFTIILLCSGTSKESRYDGGGNDLVQELYDQAVKQNNDLQDLQESIGKFYKKKNEALEKYNSYTNYNTRYYSDARQKMEQITDSVSKKKAIALISNSEKNYRNSLSDWQNRINMMNAKERELTNLHSLLQIMVSETMIVKYQSGNFPDNTRYKEAAAEIESIISRLKTLTSQ